MGKVRKAVITDGLKGCGDFLKTDEVASVLGVPSHMVVGMAERGEIPAIKIWSLWRFPKEKLREHLERWRNASKMFPARTYLNKARRTRRMSPRRQARYERSAMSSSWSREPGCGSILLEFCPLSPRALPLPFAARRGLSTSRPHPPVPRPDVRLHVLERQREPERPQPLPHVLRHPVLVIQPLRSAPPNGPMISSPGLSARPKLPALPPSMHACKSALPMSSL